MTAPPNETRLIAIGSHHGDDQIGWVIADCLLQRHGRICDIRKATVPMDVLNWLDGVHTLHIVDACQGPHDNGHLHRWEWGELPVFCDTMLHTGSHDFDVLAVLRLAERLHKLPAHVVIWGIQGNHFGPLDSLSVTIVQRLPEIVETIANECVGVTNTTDR
ncbi:MAG: hydrogenase maturation protease [Planctomycetaceae bacterium]